MIAVEDSVLVLLAAGQWGSWGGMGIVLGGFLFGQTVEGYMI